MRIEVRGKPAPQGNHRVNRAGAMYESSKAVGPWREAVRAEVQRWMDREGWRWLRPGGMPPTGPVEVKLVFQMIRPKGHFGTGRNAAILRKEAPGRPHGKPDLDKLARAVLDGLTAGGAWKDDSQVVVLAAEKLYAPLAGCVITVTELED